MLSLSRPRGGFGPGRHKTHGSAGRLDLVVFVARHAPLSRENIRASLNFPFFNLISHFWRIVLKNMYTNPGSWPFQALKHNMSCLLSDMSLHLARCREYQAFKTHIDQQYLTRRLADFGVIRFALRLWLADKYWNVFDA